MAFLSAALFAMAIVGVAGSQVLAQAGTRPSPAAFGDAQDARAALNRARAAAGEARRRGAMLERRARSATLAAERTANEAAALAANIQEAEAGIAFGTARLALIDAERRVLGERLAMRQKPLVRLTAALQKLARRPLALSALQPGSLQDTVYLRAMLETTIPQVRQRTAALRTEIARGERLAAEGRRTLASLRGQERALAERRQALASLETRQRLASRRAVGNADREEERALALAEEARDLDALVGQLDAAGALRRELAALPGPIMRPARPRASEVASGEVVTASADVAPSEAARPAPAATAPPRGYQLPVQGRTVAGFGSIGEGGTPRRGISLAPVGGAQIVAPAAGRVAFAGPYRGYDNIVILEHAGGWTSLVTGLARTDVTVGETLVSGTSLGTATARSPVVTLELRRNGTPVNPLNHLD